MTALPGLDCSGSRRYFSRWQGNRTQAPLMGQSRQGLADLDLNMTGAAMALFDARMRLRAGDHRGAEEAIQDALRTGRRCGDRWVESTALVDLAHVVVAAGRRQDAARAVAEIDTCRPPATPNGWFAG